MFTKTLLIIGICLIAAYSQCTCEDGQVFDPAINECVTPFKQVENCANYHLDGKHYKCDICKDGFYLNDKKVCPQAETIENCTKYSNKNTCFVCEKDFYLSVDNKSCLAYPTTEDDGKIANCEIYKYSGGHHPDCQQCAEKYYKSGPKTCVPLNDLNDECVSAQEYKHTYVCASCNAGYYLSFDDFKCLGNPESAEKGMVENCSRYQHGAKKADNPVCVQCETGKALTKDKNNKSICANPTKVVDECLNYEFNDKQTYTHCVECEENYFASDEDGEGVSECSKCPQGELVGNVICFGIVLAAFVALLF